MARVTVFINDNLLQSAREKLASEGRHLDEVKNTSKVMQIALTRIVVGKGRPEASQRGRIETLRTVRAARAALSDVEATLTQARPVRRSVRRYSAARRA